jgi:hypothetical protein
MTDDNDVDCELKYVRDFWIIMHHNEYQWANGVIDCSLVSRKQRWIHKGSSYGAK